MHAHARLYTLAEVAEAKVTAPSSELDARFWCGIQGAVQWSQIEGVRCAFCNGPLGGQATYLVVLMPGDPEAGWGSSGACCVPCGSRLPRERLQELAEAAARVMFDPVAGHA